MKAEFMKKSIKVIAFIMAGSILLVAGMQALSWLRYGPLAIFGHRGISITLPYGPENEPKSMLPLGEKEDIHPDGHPGIDFQWDYSAPLIAAFDGTISSVTNEKDMGEPVLYVTLKNGEYSSVYKELGSVAFGIKRGSRLSKGDIIGYPHGHYFADSGGHAHYQVHWEFGYSSFPGFIRLCPLIYLDQGALARINALWEKVKPNHQNPTGQMICNGEFYGKDR